jgi:taurine--2-oxoglutarate transaminase
MIELEGGSNKVAAVIVEPVVGSNGIIPPPAEYYPRLREICDRWEVVLIADETMTGFGRTGKLFAIEHYGIVPDIIVMGKALGVYCPLTAAVFSNKIARVFDDNVFGHGQSFSAHALGCAAALAGINLLCKDEMLDRVTEMGQYLGNRLKTLEQRHRSVGDVRGIGLFWTLELVRNRQTKEPFRKQLEKYAPNVLTEIAAYLLREKNIYIPADKFGIWIVPPLIVDTHEIDFIVDSIDEALKIADDEVVE